METRQTNFSKGEEGEKRIAKRLIELGYNSIHVGGATKYQIDGGKFWSGDLASYGLGRTFWVQVKNKEPRKLYPDTGLEKYRFEALKYLTKESGCPTLLLFTDNTLKIYGEWVDNLEEEHHPGTYNEKDRIQMIYFWLKNLKSIEQLVF